MAKKEEDRKIMSMNIDSGGVVEFEYHDDNIKWVSSGGQTIMSLSSDHDIQVLQQLSNLKCPECEYPVLGGWNFCPQCGKVNISGV